jgi:hypothetical protein
MSLAIVLIVVAALSLVFIVSTHISRSLQISGKDQLAIQPMDVEAFRNLADPAEREYLRRRLPAAEFRTVQRERLRAMAAYIQLAGRNAAILIQIGQSALVSPDPQAADAARQMINNALLLRRNAMVALFKIRFALVYPGAELGSVPIVEGYERLNGSAMLLGRLQNPTMPVRISGI